MTTIAERFDRLDLAIQHERICRDAWVDAQGRTCLLLTLAPEILILPLGIGNVAPELRYDPRLCPADLMPAWLVGITPRIDDNGSRQEWPAMIRRYASVVRRACLTFDADAWNRVYVRLILNLLNAVLAGHEHVLTPAQEKWLDQTRATEMFYSFAELAVEGSFVRDFSDEEWMVQSRIDALFCFLQGMSEPGDHDDLLAFVRCCIGRAVYLGFRGQPFPELPPFRWDLVFDTVLGGIESALPQEAA